MLVGTTSIEKSEQLAEFLKSQGYTHDRLHRPQGGARQALRGRARGQAVEAVRRAQRALPRAGSLYRRGSRRARRHHGRDQHGGPRHRHSARRQRRDACRAGMRRIGRRPSATRRKPKSARKSRHFKEKAIAAGGLYIIGTERHESRRIDNQLRGRAGRQGDPGRSKFFLSLAGRSHAHLRLGAHGDDAGEARPAGGRGDRPPWINKAIEKAQHKVEARNFDMRKNMLKFDNVMNDQRKVIFERRREIMAEESVEEADRRHARRGRRGHGRAPYSARRLCRGLGRRRPRRGHAGQAQSRSAGRRLGQGRRHRRRGNQGAAAARRRTRPMPPASSRTRRICRA